MIAEWSGFGETFIEQYAADGDAQRRPARYAGSAMKAALHALGLVLLLGGVPLAAGPAAAASPPVFRETPCPFPGGDQAAEYDIECGYVTVPERRDRETSRTIELAVAILHSNRPNSGEDPVLFLSGGPGDGALIGIAPLWGGSTIRERHDLILLDQRGTGYSHPALPCQPLDFPPSLYLAQGEADAERVRLATICLDAYREQGIDVTAYTTRESAADVESVRQALGIDRWSLYGISYGTRLALEVMRTNGSSVKGAVLDSAYPPQVRPFEDANARFERALDATLAACRADAACSDAYPGIGGRLSTILSNGAAQLDGDYPPIPAWYAASVLNSMLYTPDGIATVPAVVDGLERGNAMVIRQRDATWVPNLVEASATGMQYSVECHDRAFDVDEAAVAADRAANSRYGSIERTRMNLPVCAAWRAEPPSPEELEPVVSDVPTLVLVGALDPVTPPTYAVETIRTLRNGSVVELPGLGHAVTLTPCGRQLRDAFLADPSAPLDRSCVEAMPRATFSVEIASAPGLPYLLDGMFARSNPTIGHVGLMLVVAIAFLSALAGWPLAAAVAAIRARRRQPVASSGGDAAADGTWRAEHGPIRRGRQGGPRERPVARLARLTALLAVGVDVVFVIGLVRVIGAMPDGSYIRALGVPRQDRWLIWLADAGAVLAVAVAVLTAALLVRRADRRRSRIHLAFVASGCLLFSGTLAYYRILGS